ncbi:putative GTP cyclohydrolase 1 type 2 [Oxobacter pfennigii]|uniref:GTP cyclohydrolase 1 type 2 homolog n=1 Tax=Oxobacter pfennigii TaxID=36849 RepID=A0A0P8YAP9_9CLOT|nr:Nif3-like dinuclear metal center hexameric protein [Oxobacter pfennigii]KPU44084.1 putative GTP cyclohydrolase 1 type 2 [Oxobacter pfennigii]
MSVKCKDIVRIIENLAPIYLAAEWDNSGLLIGDEEQQIKSVMVALDINKDVLDEAYKLGCDMIITHHPVIFSTLKSLNSNNFKEKIIRDIVSKNISVYSAHTSLDAADGGTNDLLADILKMKNVEVLDKTEEEKLYKVSVFVPKGYQEKVREAIISSGAGHIGNYSGCTFNTNGIGTFLPLEGSKPFIGEMGILEKVDEIKIETIATAANLENVINSILKAHPYEEPAYDIYPLYNKGRKYGFGRVGILDNPVTLKELCQKLKEVLKTDNLRAVGNLDAIVKKAALCSGSGADLLEKSYNLGCDVYITGDVKYHDACDARDMGMALIDAGHFATENIYMPQLMNYLNDEFTARTMNVKLYISNANKDPFSKV